jgi:hypothetical protein
MIKSVVHDRFCGFWIATEEKNLFVPGYKGYQGKDCIKLDIHDFHSYNDLRQMLKRFITVKIDHLEGKLRDAAKRRHKRLWFR